MNCPHCQIPLLMTERKGVEIDYCSQCRGIWLDKGELDKIIELSVPGNDHGVRQAGGYRKEAPRREPEPHYNDHSYSRSKDYKYRNDHGDYRHPYRKKKKTLLGEIFDIFD